MRVRAFVPRKHNRPTVDQVGIKVALEHRTVYRFDRLNTVNPHVIRLRPAPHSRTPIESYSLTITPPEHFINWQQDPFGNFLARVVFPEPSRELSITVGLVADLEVFNPFDFFIEEYAETYGFRYPAELAADLEPYLRHVDEGPSGSGPGPAIKGWLRRFPIARPTLPSSRSSCSSTRRCNATSPTRCGWSPVSRPPTTRCCPGRVVPGLLLAARLAAPRTRTRRALRLGLPRPADGGHPGARRPERPGRGLHRPARVGGGLHPRRGLDRHGPDVGTVRRRGAHPALGHPASRHAPPRSPGRPGSRSPRWSSRTRSPGSTRTRG